MTSFLKTNLDLEGKLLRIETGIKSADGTCYLVLHRLPPEYAKPPTFVVRLSGEVMEVRGDQPMRFFKAFAMQEFTPKELGYLKGLRPGANHAPFLNFSYPNVLKRIGKTVYCMTESEIAAIVDPRCWKLVGDAG